MKRGDILAITIAVVLAVIAARIIFPSEVGAAINGVIDMLVVLTTTEEHRLSQLEPDTQAKVRELLQRMANLGYQVQVGQTLRSPAQEQAVIAEGKSGIKAGGHSWHEIGRAVDLYPVDPETGVADMDGRNDSLFITMHQQAADLGLRNIAYNDFWERKYITNAKGKKIWDGGHVENWGPYASKADAIAAEGPSYGIA